MGQTQGAGDRAPVRRLPLEDLVEPVSLETWQRLAVVGHPPRDVLRIGLAYRSPQLLPGPLGHHAIDVMVAGHREKALRAQLKGIKGLLDELGGNAIVVFMAALGHITGEADHVDGTVLVEQRLEVVLPRLAQHLMPPPSGSTIPAGMQVREVKDTRSQSHRPSFYQALTC